MFIDGNDLKVIYYESWAMSNAEAFCKLRIYFDITTLVVDTKRIQRLFYVDAVAHFVGQQCDIHTNSSL